MILFLSILTVLAYAVGQHSLAGQTVSGDVAETVVMRPNEVWVLTGRALRPLTSFEWASIKSVMSRALGGTVGRIRWIHSTFELQVSPHSRAISLSLPLRTQSLSIEGARRIR